MLLYASLWNKKKTKVQIQQFVANWKIGEIVLARRKCGDFFPLSYYCWSQNDSPNWHWKQGIWLRHMRSTWVENAKNSHCNVSENIGRTHSQFDMYKRYFIFNASLLLHPPNQLTLGLFFVVLFISFLLLLPLSVTKGYNHKNPSKYKTDFFFFFERAFWSIQYK